jgi:hypothetical protein
VSRYSAPDKLNGDAWGEIVWLHRPEPEGRYVVTVGPRRIGEVWRMGRRRWHAISYAQGADLLGLRGVAGFGTRWAATEYLLEVGVRPLDRTG